MVLYLRDLTTWAALMQPDRLLFGQSPPHYCELSQDPAVLLYFRRIQHNLFIEQTLSDLWSWQKASEQMPQVHHDQNSTLFCPPTFLLSFFSREVVFLPESA